MSRSLVLRRQMPMLQIITNVSLMAYGVLGVLAGPGMAFPALCGAIGLLLLSNAIANLKVMKIEVNALGVYNNGLLIVEAKDVAKAEAVGGTLVVHTISGAQHHLPAFDISRHGRRQFVATINDHPPRSAADEAPRISHVQ